MLEPDDTPNPRAQRSQDAPSLATQRPEPLGARARRWAWILGIWTLVTLLCAAQSYASQVTMDRPLTWWWVLRRCAEEWYLWAVLCIPIVWVSNRYPLEPGKLRHSLVMHGASAVLTALVFFTALAWLLDGQTSWDGSLYRYSEIFAKLFFNYMVLCLTMYVTILFAHHGWHYYQRYRERERQAASLAAELAEARLDALRMQLNPHFLFNTLHAISALIHENPEGADRMVARLSDLLRVTLDPETRQETTLRRELDFLDRYIEIERTRFQDRLSVTLAVEPGLEEAFVPFLLLQPLVENAIRHGIEPREDMGQVEIRACRSNGAMELTVSDNGPGLPDGTSSPPREGVGLSNTRSRLLHLYGPHQQLVLSPRPGGGLQARILLPLRFAASAPAPAPSQNENPDTHR